MQKREFSNIKTPVSLLGFGCMRLPVLDENDNSTIDTQTAQSMVDYAMAHGVNYYDTAYKYHGGASETFIGEALKKYPRDSFLLATKFPAMLPFDTIEQVEAVFNEQLQKCQVEHFDFYLLHALSAESYERMEALGAYDLFRQKQKEGKITHFGFSFHDSPQVLQRIVNEHSWDFAQIQFNYVDYTATDAKTQYEILATNNISVLIMEPLRGGALTQLNDAAIAILQQAEPQRSIASWGIRYAATPPGVMCVLSGMSAMEHVVDNIQTMENFLPISAAEQAVLSKAVTVYNASGTIPCTGCRYCMDCPAGVDIPAVFSVYNLLLANGRRVAFDHNYRMLGESKQAHNCISCGICVDKCPQQLPIPEYMARIAEDVG